MEKLGLWSWPSLHLAGDLEGAVLSRTCVSCDTYVMFKNEASHLTSRTDDVDVFQLLAAVDDWARDLAQVPRVGVGCSEAGSETSGSWKALNHFPFQGFHDCQHPLPE